MGTGEIARFPHHRRSRGLTLVESLTTLAVASILATMAIPPMQEFIARTRMSVEVNNFVASLYLARSEAVKRLQNVNVCPTDSYGGCDATTQNWGNGWKIYYTDTATGNDVVLQQNPALPDRFEIAGNQNSFAYTPTGQLNGNGGTYTFCDTENLIEAHDVVVSNDGRVRTQLDAAGCTVAASDGGGTGGGGTGGGGTGGGGTGGGGTGGGGTGGGGTGGGGNWGGGGWGGGGWGGDGH